MISRFKHSGRWGVLGLAVAAAGGVLGAGVVMAQPATEPSTTTQPAGAAVQPNQQSGGRPAGRGGNGRSSTSGSETRPVSASTTTPATRTVDLTPPHQPWSHYQVIAQRNMFTRGSSEASRPRPGGQSGENRGGGQARPTATWILTGVVIRDEQAVAFFENSMSGMTVRVEAGQSVGDLQVTAIHSDRVEIQTGAGTRDVQIGGTADGRQPTFSSGSGSIFGDADSVAPAAGGSSGGGSLSETERRLRERRARERGQ